MLDTVSLIPRLMRRAKGHLWAFLAGFLVCVLVVLGWWIGLREIQDPVLLTLFLIVISLVALFSLFGPGSTSRADSPESKERAEERDRLLGEIADLKARLEEGVNDRIARLETEKWELASARGVAEQKRDELQRALEREQEAYRATAERLAATQAAHAALRGQNDALQKDHDELRGRNTFLESDVAAKQERIGALSAEADDLREKIRNLGEFNGKVWERDRRCSIASFRPADERRARIISVVNLKGGVGKTTLAANLGVTWWKEGRRVLLVDLDYQASLTSLCLTVEEQGDLYRRDHYIHRLFELNGDPVAQFKSWVTRILPKNEGFLVAADDRLADAEMQAMAQWLLDPHTFDARYLLREVLHGSNIVKEYDYILLDCPPRLTTACINGLTCSDYVLIPLLLDKVSIDAVPRLLGHLRRLHARVFPELCVLGVVANRAGAAGRSLTIRQQNLWKVVPRQCEEEWRQPVHCFTPIIPTFTEAMQKMRFAAFHGSLQDVFTKLVGEIQERMTSHERRSTPVLR